MGRYALLIVTHQKQPYPARGQPHQGQLAAVSLQHRHQLVSALPHAGGQQLLAIEGGGQHGGRQRHDGPLVEIGGGGRLAAAAPQQEDE
ncbi:hypothetical protein D3C73_1405910 [compost metagenome]